MTGGWYNWSERRCPPAEPGCYALAWRHAVDAMRSVPGQHFRFLWTVYPGAVAAVDAWPGASYVDLVGTDVYDWYGGPNGTYPRTASGQLDHDARWRRSSPSPAASTGSRSVSAHRQAGRHPRVGTGLPQLRRPGRPGVHHPHARVVARPPRDRRLLGVPARSPFSGCPSGPLLAGLARSGRPGRGERPEPAARRPPAIRRGIPVRRPASLRFLRAAAAGRLHRPAHQLHPRRPAGAATVPSYNARRAGRAVPASRHPDALAAFRQGFPAPPAPDRGEHATSPFSGTDAPSAGSSACTNRMARPEGWRMGRDGGGSTSGRGLRRGSTCCAPSGTERKRGCGPGPGGRRSGGYRGRGRGDHAVGGPGAVGVAQVTHAASRTATASYRVRSVEKSADRRIAVAVVGHRLRRVRPGEGGRGQTDSLGPRSATL